MIEITIHGRGGQGGVTLAKLIATAHFLKGQYAQAFGVYAAERSGAPLQAFVRIDSKEITIHNQVRTPDHLIVLDRTLISPGILVGHKPEGWILLNTSDDPLKFAEMFPGRCVASVDATSIAVEHKLGTRTVPIVNTTLLGAVGRMMDLSWQEVNDAIAVLKFGGANVSAARVAFESVQSMTLAGHAELNNPAVAANHVAGILDPDVGGPPKIRTGNWATRQPHRRRMQAPCSHACPAGNDVPGFVAAVSEGNHDEAMRILLETTPLPGVCGRVCPAPCMDACNRSEFDEPVQVRDLERFAAEKGQRPVPTMPSREERIAIVGSGPAGLSCAYQLGRLGYRVKVFDAGFEPGGLLRTGIPEYRLPHSVLDDEIDYIRQHGVEFEGEQFIDRERLLLLTREFDAIFVAAGLQQMRGLDLGSACGDAVIQGIDFLERAQEGSITCSGQRVVVVGGGNTAIDSARSALRLGAIRVTILYRRTHVEMPAIQEEIVDALEEGVELRELVLPKRAAPGKAGLTLTCSRMRLGDPDATGRRSPVPITGADAEFDIDCDLVILALGQSADLSILPEGAEVNKDAELLGLTGAPVILGGDLAKNEGTVAHAIGNGRRGALHIHRTLTGEDLFPPATEPIATREFIHTHLFDHASARHAPVVSPDRRRRSFVEVREGFAKSSSQAPAIQEAKRCFSCGMCTECDRCVEYCPEGILLHRHDGQYEFNYDYCKGCGVCASQCPRGVVYMTEL
ncbi:MAG: 2-oxoacid:acceptor oxidoreductase family protein [Phycisphaerales bacterium]|nr:2-oxoacid:acceptor oxidoreductase family protein [Phycisphaerales bacterium]MCB9854550.1 2-oxoacid:acceptor oxidoreductase family protein [Phycisphaerales bacterium]MCB9863205.1 2-oxoacid:acceptor oxidoreductase family protein [Phycisphaerales bacterium]